jgi:hypothetical protein
LAKGFDDGDEFDGKPGEVGQRLMDHEGPGRRRAGSGATGRAFGGDTLALDKQDGLIGFIAMPGSVAFDEHAGRSVTVTEGGGKNNNNILETTHITQ